MIAFAGNVEVVVDLELVVEVHTTGRLSAAQYFVGRSQQAASQAKRCFSPPLRLTPSTIEDQGPSGRFDIDKLAMSV